MPTRQELEAELARRGVKVPNSSPNYSRSELEAELSRRGVAIPSQKTSPNQDLGIGSGDWSNITDTLSDFGTGAKTSVGSIAGGLNQVLMDYSSLGPLLQNLYGKAGLQKSDFEAANSQRQAEVAGARTRSPVATFLGELGGGAAVPLPGVSAARGARTLGQGIKQAIAPSAAMGGIYSGLNYVPEGESRTGNTAMGLLAGGLLGPAVGAASRGSDVWKQLHPFNVAARNTSISTEDLLKNAEAARGTNTPLGRIINSQFLNSLQENILTKLPFSGAAKNENLVGEQLESLGERLYSDLSKGRSELGKTADEAVLNELRGAYRGVSDEKKRLYGLLNEEAGNLGLRESGANVSRISKEILDEASSSPRLSSQLPGDVRRELEVFSSPSSATLREADLFRGHLGEKAKKYGREGEDYLKGIYSALRSGTESDIEEAINASGSTKLKGLRDDAVKYYRENVAPFKQREFSKYLNDPNVNPDKLIRKFFKPGPLDEAEMASRLLNNLQRSPSFPAATAAIREGYYAPALNSEGRVSPSSLATMFRKTGPNTQQQLLRGAENSPELMNRMANYERLVGLNPRALMAGYNPKTGYALADIIPYASTVGGSAVGHSMGGPLGALLGGVVGSGAWGPRQISNFLTSPEFREDMVKRILESRKPQSGRDDLMAQALSSYFSKAAGAKTGKDKGEKK